MFYLPVCYSYASKYTPELQYYHYFNNKVLVRESVSMKSAQI